jgi:hypothetical protein
MFHTVLDVSQRTSRKHAHHGTLKGELGILYHLPPPFQVRSARNSAISWNVTLRALREYFTDVSAKYTASILSVEAL